MLKISNYTNYILENISFEIENKNIIILGSNGAGKTTLAKVLSGLIQSKCVSLQNKPLSQIPYEKRVAQINYIPAKLEIFDEYIDVEAFLTLNQFSSKNTIDEILKKLEIFHLKKKNCSTLSSGESQLVLLASAILHHAKYTILDEPTANLDPQKLKNVFKILASEKSLQHKIIITHNLHLAYKLGYDIVFIDDGRVKFQGKSEHFFLQKNLDTLYDNTVKNTHNTIVIDL